jgi:hypothetical protein
MSDAPEPRRASTPAIIFSAFITLYFLYVLIPGNGLSHPLVLIVLYVLAIIANAVFLATVIMRRK